MHLHGAKTVAQPVTFRAINEIANGRRAAIIANVNIVAAGEPSSKETLPAHPTNIPHTSAVRSIILIESSTMVGTASDVKERSGGWVSNGEVEIWTRRFVSRADLKVHNPPPAKTLRYCTTSLMVSEHQGILADTELSSWPFP